MSKPRKRAMPKAVKAWGGFVNGRLDTTLEYDWTQEGRPACRQVAAVYRNRRQAREAYQDVRSVLITPLPEKRNGR